MARSLWRLDGATVEALTQPMRLEAGLRLHFEHTDLVTALVQIGTRQQAYAGAVGCEGCAYHRCVPGCYVELLHRLLRASFEACTLSAVPGGLARRPYTQAALAWPSRHGTLFDSSSITAWPEARLIVHWQRGARGQLTTAALLATGNDPDPVAFLRERGWMVPPLPRSVALHMANSPIPSTVWFKRGWSGEPFLLIPHQRLMPTGNAVGVQDDAPADASVGALAETRTE
jgi:hypothetical protein